MSSLLAGPVQGRKSNISRTVIDADAECAPTQSNACPDSWHAACNFTAYYRKYLICKGDGGQKEKLRRNRFTEQTIDCLFSNPQATVTAHAGLKGYKSLRSCSPDTTEFESPHAPARPPILGRRIERVHIRTQL